MTLRPESVTVHPPESDIINLDITGTVKDFSSLTTGLKSLPSRAEPKKLKYFQGPLQKNPYEPYKFPEEGQFREWIIPESVLKLVELNLDGNKTLAIVNQVDNSAITFQPKFLAAHEQHAAVVSRGVMQYEIKELEKSVQSKSNVLFTDALMGVIHEAMHIEDAENQPIVDLRHEFTDICDLGKSADLMDYPALTLIVNKGIVTPEELINSVQILLTLDGVSTMYTDGNKEAHDKSKAELFRDRIIDILIERRNSQVTKAAIIEFFGSLEQFDALCGCPKGTVNSLCDKAVESRRLYVPKTLYDILDQDIDTPLHRPVVARATQSPISFTISSYV